MPEFKVGDRVRTTDFPATVTEARGHRIGDAGTIIARRHSWDRWVVQFDPTPGRTQGVRQEGHDGCWTCRREILELLPEITPEMLQQAALDLTKMIHELDEENV